MSAEFRIILDDETTPERRPPAPPAPPAAGAQPPPAPIPLPAAGAPPLPPIPLAAEPRPPDAGPVSLPVAGLLADVLAETVAKMGAMPQGRRGRQPAEPETYGVLPPDDPTYKVRPAEARPQREPPPDATVRQYQPAAVNPLFEQTAAGINRLAEANRNLREAVADGSYLSQQRELIGLRKEEAALAAAAARQGMEARYGATGAAVTRAGDFAAPAARGAQVAGGVAAQAFGGDNVGALAGAAGAVGQALGNIPGPAGAVGKALQAGAVAVGAFERVVGAVVERGRELQNYSGRLAVANANADIIKMAADIREANANGARMAVLTEKAAQAQADINDALNELKGAVVEVLIPLVDGLKTATTVGLEVFKATQAPLLLAVRVLRGINELGEDAAKAKAAEDRRKAADEVTSLFDNLLDAGRSVKPFGVNPDALGDLKAAKLAGPTFGVGQ